MACDQRASRRTGGLGQWVAPELEIRRRGVKFTLARCPPADGCDVDARGGVGGLVLQRRVDGNSRRMTRNGRVFKVGFVLMILGLVGCVVVGLDR